MRIFFVRLLTLFALAVFCVLCGCSRQKVLPVTVTIDTKNPGPAIPPDFMGLSIEVKQLLPDEKGVHYFRPDNTALINVFRTLGIRNFRIGGSTSDRNAEQLPGEADLDSAFGFAKAAGVKVIYTLRLRGGDPQVDIQTVKYIMAHYADELDCFSIGQEPSAYPKPYTYVNFREDWKKFADAIIAAAPDVKLCGPEVHNNGMWARRFMQDFGRSNNVMLVTEHLYPGGAPRRVATPEDGRDMMLTADTTVSNNLLAVCRKLHNDLEPLAVSNNLPYRLDEVNSFFGGGVPDVSDTFASSLWGLDFAWWWAAHGAAGLNFHTGDDVAFGSDLVPSSYSAYYTAADGFDIHPLAYGLKAFDFGSRGRLVPVTISDPTNLNLSAYAVVAGDKSLCVTLINKDYGTNAPDISVTISIPSTDYAAGSVIYLKAPQNDVAANSGVTLGGSEIKNDGSWDGKWAAMDIPKNNNPGNGVFNLKLSPASAAVVKLTAK